MMEVVYIYLYIYNFHHPCFYSNMLVCIIYRKLVALNLGFPFRTVAAIQNLESKLMCIYVHRFEARKLYRC